MVVGSSRDFWDMTYDVFRVMSKLPSSIKFFHPLALSMEHYRWISTTVPSHSEACFCFKPGLVRGLHTHNETQRWPGFWPTFSRWCLRAQRCTTEPSRYPRRHRANSNKNNTIKDLKKFDWALLYLLPSNCPRETQAAVPAIRRRKIVAVFMVMY